MFDAQRINKTNRILLVIFFAIQPILEIIVSLFRDDFLAVAGIPISTIIRYLLFAAIFILAVLANIKNKYTWGLIGYAVVCVVYILFHYYNVKDFDLVVNEINAKKTLIQCAFNVSEYMVPVCVILLVLILNFDYQHFKFSAIIGSAIAAVSLVATNLLGLDFISYGYGSNDHPKGSLLSWFFEDVNSTNWEAYTSRGLFDSGNAIGAFLSLLLPVTVFMAFKEKKILLFVLSFLQVLSLLMVSTRISVFGAILLFVIMLGIWLFDAVFNKVKINLKSLICVGVSAVLFVTVFMFSPFVLRMTSGEGFNNNYAINENINNSMLEGGQSVALDYKLEFIRDNYTFHYIPEVFINKYYPYEEHTDFWFDLMTNVDFSQRDNARKIKGLILKDIMTNKNSPMDRWLGIGEMGIYPEADFVATYYSYGVVGVVLFLLPYLLIVAATIIKLLIELFKKRFDMMSYSLVLALGFVLASAFYAGNTMVYAFINIFIGLVAGVLLQKIKIKVQEDTPAEDGKR